MPSQLSDREARLFEMMESARYENSRVLVYRIKRIYESGNADMRDVIDVYLAKCKGLDYAEQRRKLTTRQMERCREHFKNRMTQAEESPLGWSPVVVSRLRQAGWDGRLSRLDLLLLELSCIVMLMYDEIWGEERDYHEKAASESWDWTLWCTYSALGRGRDYEALSDEEIYLIIFGPDSADFGERLRYQRNETDSGVRLRVRAASAGGRMGELRASLTKWLKNRRAATQARARTDNVEYSTRAQMEAYQDMGADLVMISNPLDERTTPICWEMYGTVLPLDECVPWDTAPPFHYNCRSVLVPAGDVDAAMEWKEFRRSLVDWKTHSGGEQ